MNQEVDLEKLCKTIKRVLSERDNFDSYIDVKIIEQENIDKLSLEE
jgi:hypothetical protein|nr:hypothetical protein [uncultured Lachnoclostridium sp.]